MSTFADGHRRRGRTVGVLLEGRRAPEGTVPPRDGVIDGTAEDLEERFAEFIAARGFAPLPAKHCCCEAPFVERWEDGERHCVRCGRRAR